MPYNVAHHKRQLPCNHEKVIREWVCNTGALCCFWLWLTLIKMQEVELGSYSDGVRGAE